MYQELIDKPIGPHLSCQINVDQAPKVRHYDPKDTARFQHAIALANKFPSVPSPEVLHRVGRINSVYLIVLPRESPPEIVHCDIRLPVDIEQPEMAINRAKERYLGASRPDGIIHVDPMIGSVGAAPEVEPFLPLRRRNIFRQYRPHRQDKAGL